MKTLFILMLIPSLAFGETALEFWERMQERSDRQAQRNALESIADSQAKMADSMRRQNGFFKPSGNGIVNYLNPDAGKSYAEQFDQNQANQLSAEQMRQQIRMNEMYLEMLKRK